ncbi:hypothetical protein KJ940_14155, partial [Myxococcota bacterium]|nr:hypothetical protein [Myxococcota bacterium]
LAARAHQHAEALARWDRAQATPPTLARALLRLRLLDLEGASRDINALLRRISGDGLWEALLLERVWLAIELEEPPARIDALLERGLERLGPTPALIARLEIYALSQGRHALLLRGLEARLEAAAPEDRHGARVKRAWALERLGRWEEALVAWREAHAQRPEDHEPLDRALALCRRLGRVELEWSLLQRRATRPGLDAAAIYYQAGLLAREILDEPARAAEDFERAVAARPDFGPALAALGRADLRQGRHEDLDARFQAEIEALSEDEEAHRPRLIDRLSRLAELRAARGDQITAARLLWRAHALDPRAPTAPLALRLAEARRWRDLARLYLDPPPLDDPDEATRQRLAAALLRLCAHEDEAAARIYERRLQRDPQDDEAAEGYLAARPGDLALRVAREEGGALRAAQRAEWLADGGHQATERYLALSRQAPDDPLILEGRLRLFARAPRLALLEGLDPSADPRIAEAYLRLDQHTALLGEGIAAWIARAAATRLGGRAADVALMTHARALEAAGDVGGAIEAWATAAISQAWRAPHRAVEAAEAITRLDPEHAWAGRLAPLIEASARPRRAAPAHEGGEAASRRAALLEMACRATGDEAEALRALAEPSADDARRRFEAAPRRRDLFLRALAGATPSQARALRLRRLNFAPPDERRALLRGLITDGLARGDEEATTQAMEALARLDPADLTLALARDHLDGGLTPPAALLQATAAPRNQLALHRRGARDPDLTIRRRHLEAAVALAPEDRGLLDALAETLTALGDAHAVAALDAHDEGHPRRLLAQAALMSEPRAALRLKLSALRLSRDPRLALEVLADAGALGHAEAAIEAFQLSDQGDEARARLARA